MKKAGRNTKNRFGVAATVAVCAVGLVAWLVAGASGQVVRAGNLEISIDGSINPAVDDFIRESIGRAKANGAKALIIQLDTPGGLLNSTRTIVKEMLGAEVPVMVYVSPSGAGAGRGTRSRRSR